MKLTDFIVTDRCDKCGAPVFKHAVWGGKGKRNKPWPPQKYPTCNHLKERR